jgi:Sulfotransferase family
VQAVRFLHSLRHAYRRSLYDQNNKVIFIPISKNASTSMEHFFAGKAGRKISLQDFGGIKAAQTESRLINICGNPISAWKAYRECFRFTIVRDPVERFISARNMIFSSTNYLTAMERKTGRVLEPDTAIDTLIEYLQKTTLPDAHFLPQSYFISGMNVHCRIRLGMDRVTEKLEEYGLENWVSGFGERKANSSVNFPVVFSSKQKAFLDHYYQRDFELMQD